MSDITDIVSAMGGFQAATPQDKAALEVVLGSRGGRQVSGGGPVFVSAPSISGVPIVGQALSGLTYTDGTVTGGSITARSILLAGTAVAASYVLQAADVGKTVIYRNASGALTSNSPGVTVIEAGTTAVITSAPTYTQPAGTQRFQRATADRAGTWALSGTDAASYTIDGATGIRSITSAAAAAMVGIGANTTRTTILTFTPSDGGTAVTQAVTDTFTPVAAGSSLAETFDAVFSGADGTLVTATPGFALKAPSPASAYDIPRLISGRVMGEPSPSKQDKEGEWAAVHTFASPRPNTEVTFTVWRASADNPTSSIGLWMVGNGAGNGVGMHFGPTTGTANLALRQSPYYRQNGVVTEASNWLIGDDGGTRLAYRANGTVDIVAKVSADGATLDVFVVNDVSSTKVASVALSGKTMGNEWGYSGKSAFIYAMTPNVGTTALSGKSGEGIMLTVVSAPTFVQDNAPTYALSWTGPAAPTALEVQWVDDNLSPVSSWLLADTIVSGANVTVKPTAPRGGALTPRFRPRNDQGSVIQAQEPVALLMPRPFRVGFNLNQGAVYSGQPPLNDWGKFVKISSEGYFNVPVANIIGLCTVTTDVGVTLTGVNDGGNNTIQIISSNPATGTHRLNVLDNVPLSYPSRLIGFSSTTGLPTFFTVVRDASSAKINPDWVDAWEDFAPTWRDLDTDNTNFAPFSGQSPRNVPTAKNYTSKSDDNDAPHLPWADRLDAIAALVTAKPNFAEYWHVWPADETQADLEAKMAAFRDHPGIPARIKLLVESGNEFSFSAGVFSGVRRLMIDGLKAGYGTAGATFANPGPTLTFDTYDIYKTPTLPTPLAAGQMIALNTDSPVQMHVAASDLPAGTPFLINNNFNSAAFTQINTYNSVLAGARRQSVRVAQIKAAGTTVFGANYSKRVLPLIMGGTSLADYIPYTATIRSFHPDLAGMDYGVGQSWYFGASGVSDSQPLPNPVTAEYLVQVLTDDMDRRKTFLRRMVYDAARLGKPIYLYEGLYHSRFDAYRLNTNGYKDALDPLMRTTQWRSIVADYVGWMKRNVPGTGCGFTLLSGTPWAIKQSYKDVNSPYRLGVIDGLNS